MSSETSELQANPISGIKSHHLDIKKQKEIKNLGYERKTVLTADIKKGEKIRAISLIERGYFERDSIRYERAWREFRQADLPIIPTLRRSSQDTLLLTDLRADGTEIYGKGLLFALRDEKELSHRNSTLDSVFVDIVKTQMESISSQAYALAEQASKNHIVLPGDDPFEILVSPNGQWKLMVIDLIGAVIKSELSDAEIREQNLRLVEICLKWMKDLLRYLNKPQNFATKLKNLIR